MKPGHPVPRVRLVLRLISVESKTPAADTRDIGINPFTDRRVLRVLPAVLSLIVATSVVGHVAYAQFGLWRGSHDGLLINWLYNIGLVAAAAIPFTQMRRRPGQRVVYALFGFAILAWALGDIYWSLKLSELESPPFPSLADAGYLAFYLPAYVALLLLIRRRVARFIPSVWLDGLIAVLTCAALATALVINPILSGVGGTLSEVATNLAYPFGDLLLGLLVLLMIAVGGWRFDRQAALLTSGLATFAIADSVYVYRVAAGTYKTGTILDSLWLIGIALLAFACMFEFRHESSGRYEGWVVAVAPAVFALGAVGILAYGAIEPVPLAVPLLAIAALLVAFVRAGLTYRDVQALADAREQATTDELTGLPNRRWLIRELRQRMASPDLPRTALTIVDLNGFKEVNDTLGHQAGDAMLKLVGERMTGAVHGLGRIARLGGDEFAVLTDDLDAAEMCAARIEQGLADGFPIGELTLSVSASMGVAAYPDHAIDDSSLLRCADVALYDAKRTRTPVAIYDPGDDHHSVDNLMLTSDLRRAINNEELSLVYQPKVSLATGTVVGVEALVRWEHPTRGQVPPSEFVPLADAGGLMRPLTRLVLRIALSQARTWLDSGSELPVAVNISATDLIDTSFPNTIARLLRDHDVPAGLLQLEITETELISDSARTMETIGRLTALGVRVSLDDFGTGYSSLQHLQELRVDELKIDRAFIEHMIENDGDAAIVRCAIEMAKALNLTVVAEGVEDHDALAILAELGCDVAQGYNISRPLSALDLESWFAERRALIA